MQTSDSKQNYKTKIWINFTFRKKNKAKFIIFFLAYFEKIL